MFIRALLAVPFTTGVVAAATHEVTASNGSGFQPSQIVIQPGDTVRWRNTGGRHNVRADDGSFGNSPSNTAWVYEVTFDTPGDFRYYCEPHGTPGGGGMSGKVTVEEPQAAFLVNEGVAGSWFNPATSGQGILLDASDEAGVLAMAWFTWTGDGGYDWLTGSGGFEGNVAAITLVRSSGGRFDDPAPVENTVVGSAVLSFSDCSHATFAYELTDPVAVGEIPLQRILPPNAACLEVNPAAAPAR